MVIDTSALLAVLLGEPEMHAFIAKIEEASDRLLSAASYVESAIVIDNRYGEEGDRDLRLFLIEAQIRIEPVTLDQAEIARDAYRMFGKGNHPAGLNYGDCFAYALAMATGQSLLFKGADFARTDIRSSL